MEHKADVTDAPVGNPIAMASLLSPGHSWFGLQLPSLTLAWVKAWLRVNAATLVEIALIGLWAAWVGRAYLDFNPNTIPIGHEYNTHLPTHHLWTRLRACGWCALWDGAQRGGAPAFADTHGSMLHPLVMVTTLLWGVPVGAKVALVVSLGVAGLAQWWLAWELRLGRLARVWSGLMAVVAGHLAGRLASGIFGLVLSAAMVSLVLPALLRVARRPHYRSIVLLAVVTTSALLAGHGYMQVGLLGTLPALAFLLLEPKGKQRPLWKAYVLAGGLGLLLAAPFLVPLAHFWPYFTKDVFPDFQASQPLAYLPLNLVINDVGYYATQVLGKLPWVELYTLYIGWTPVLLAGVGLGLGRREDRRQLGFLVAIMLLAFLVASAVVLRWAAVIAPGVAGIRHSSLIAGLAVPPILALAAYGLDRLLAVDWPDGRWRGQETGLRRLLSSKWLMLIPLTLALRSAYDFSQLWLTTKPMPPEAWALLEALQTPDLQWVQPPYGVHLFTEPAVRLGLKISPGYRPWDWRDRQLPPAVLEASLNGPPTGATRELGTVVGIPIYAREGEAYAAVVTAAGQEPCTATGLGGYLKVTCNSSASGRLVVKENTWTGWRAWQDGQRMALVGRQWLEVEAPAGAHTYVFRYLPWDVPLGLFLAGVGLVACVRLWRRNGRFLGGCR
ncbi:MAG: hypothetical protein AB1791_12370 [Chloroflexota bacterium]